MALTEVYVDPSIAANSGSGTSGSPYGDLQYAMDQTTLGTDGTRFNIKAGTDEILTAALSFTTHGAPTATQPVIFQGYTTTAGDGGQGGIEGTTNTVQIISGGTVDYVKFIDMSLVTSSSSSLLDIDNACLLYNCYCQNTGTGNVLDIDNGNVFSCEIVSAGGFSVAGFNVSVNSCYIRNTTTSGGGLQCAELFRSVIALDLSGVSNTEFFAPAGDDAAVINNTFKATATPGGQVWAIATTTRENVFAANNYIEGFTGTSGGGIHFESGGEGGVAINNYYYNNTTNEQDSSGNSLFINGTNLGSSAIDSNFLPAAALQALSYPTTWPGLGSTPNNLDVGAVQHTDAGGGGGAGAGIYIPSVGRFGVSES